MSQSEDLIKRLKEKQYLGDGLYAHHDGYHIVLSTERENGTHHIGLESQVLSAFDRYREYISSLMKEIKERESKL